MDTALISPIKKSDLQEVALYRHSLRFNWCL